MITEIYIDNFRCLTNFRIKPGDFQLWLGDNGSGKTSVLDALRSVQRLLRGEHVEDVFKTASLTTWDKRDEQTIRLSLVIDEEQYDYKLVIEHSRRENRARIKREELEYQNFIVFLFDGEEVLLRHVNRDANKVEGTSFAATSSRSIIPVVTDRGGGSAMHRLQEEVNDWLLIQPVPLVVNQVADSEARYLSEHAENFAQWYRHVLQEKPEIGYKAKTLLADVLPGFEQLSLKQSGDARRLTATFRIDGKDRDFDFMALSDGQRQLIVLYTVLESLRAGGVSTLFIDEPDNFVSLREIQPWIESLNEICNDEDRQAIVISHHPEILNKMARGEELWFSRQEGSHTITKPLPTVADLTPAETVARGWENE